MRAAGEAHWLPLLRARAIETQAYVVAAAQAGRHNAKRESYGHAVVIDPWGRVVAALDDPLATGIATADIDLEVCGLPHPAPPPTTAEQGTVAVQSHSYTSNDHLSIWTLEHLQGGYWEMLVYCKGGGGRPGYMSMLTHSDAFMVYSSFAVLQTSPHVTGACRMHAASMEAWTGAMGSPPHRWDHDGG